MTARKSGQVVTTADEETRTTTQKEATKHL